MLFRMIQLSENSRKLSDTYKESHSTIPWNALYGLRNRIVHDYGNAANHNRSVFPSMFPNIPLETYQYILNTLVDSHLIDIVTTDSGCTYLRITRAGIDYLNTNTVTKQQILELINNGITLGITIAQTANSITSLIHP